VRDRAVPSLESVVACRPAGTSVAGVPAVVLTPDPFLYVEGGVPPPGPRVPAVAVLIGLSHAPPPGGAGGEPVVIPTRSRRILALAATAALTVFVVLTPAAAAFAGPVADPPVILAVNDLHGVIDGLRMWVIGFLAALATLFFVVGGVRYMTAGGDPSEIERAKASFKAAAVGYSLAVLAPVLLSALQSILGV
jgi:hypothetical protein